MSDEDADSRAYRSRSNGAKSRGPATVAGKAASSMNSFRHGLRSEAVIIAPLESQEGWEAHLDALTETLAPRNYLEVLIVGRIAQQFWKLQRAMRVQAAAATARQRTVRADLDDSREAEKFRRTCAMLEMAPETTDNDVTDEQVQRLVSMGERAANLDRYEIAAERSLFRALTEYRVIRADPSIQKGRSDVPNDF